MPFQKEPTTYACSDKSNPPLKPSPTLLWSVLKIYFLKIFATGAIIKSIKVLIKAATKVTSKLINLSTNDRLKDEPNNELTPSAFLPSILPRALIFSFNLFQKAAKAFPICLPMYVIASTATLMTLTTRVTASTTATPIIAATATITAVKLFLINLAILSAVFLNQVLILFQVVATQALILFQARVAQVLILFQVSIAQALILSQTLLTQATIFFHSFWKKTLIATKTATTTAITAITHLTNLILAASCTLVLPTTLI